MEIKVDEPSGKIMVSLNTPPSQAVWVYRPEYQSNAREVKGDGRETYSLFSWDTNLPLHQVHRPVSRFARFSIESLLDHEPDRRDMSDRSTPKEPISLHELQGRVWKGIKGRTG